MKKCPKCNGYGWHATYLWSKGTEIDVTCHNCAGTGKVEEEKKEECQYCEGTGWVEYQKITDMQGNIIGIGSSECPHCNHWKEEAL